MRSRRTAERKWRSLQQLLKEPTMLALAVPVKEALSTRSSLLAPYLTGWTIPGARPARPARKGNA